VFLVKLVCSPKFNSALIFLMLCFASKLLLCFIFVGLVLLLIELKGFHFGFVFYCLAN
jgi:hypothetical protein